MLNQVIIVGRLILEPTIKEENERKTITVTLAVPRSYKNTDGEYDTDFVECRLWDSIANNVCEYCHKGDLIGVKGRIETKNIENEDGTSTRKMEIVAEKITFLSSKKNDDEE